MKNKGSHSRDWVLGGLALALLAVAGWGQAQSPEVLGAKEAPIRMTVHVPAKDAVLLINNVPTKQTGLIRYFESVPFSTSKKGTYILKVTWTDEGEEKELIEKVRVRGGDNKVVKFIKDAKDKDNGKPKGKGKGKTGDGDKDKVKDPDDKTADGDKEKGKGAGEGDKGKEKGTKDGEKNPPDKGAAAPRQRDFLFTYTARVTGLKPGQAARIWLPVPPSDATQQVKV